jgi:hypothetical protein
VEGIPDDALLAIFCSPIESFSLGAFGFGPLQEWDIHPPPRIATM